MRVLHLLSSTGFHGAENMAAALIRGLAADGVENYLGMFRSHEGSNLELLDAVEEVIVGGKVFNCRGKFDWRVIFALRRFIREHRIEVVHSHKYKTNFYAAAACIGLKCVRISTCHNWLGVSAKMRFYAALDKRLLRVFDRSVGVSEEVTAELGKYIARRRVTKVDNGIDMARFDGSISKSVAKKALGLGDHPTVGFVGRLTRDKAVSHLLRAVRLLRQAGTTVDLLVVGSGEREQELKDEASALGIAAHVHFLGRRDDTPALYAAMDVFALPSVKEAFPMVLLEAMAAAVPVVATRVGDVSYILQQGACGKLVEPGDIDALRAAIAEWLCDPDTARQTALAGQHRVRQYFSSAAMAARYKALYLDAFRERALVEEASSG